jgi:WD40 repeat protein
MYRSKTCCTITLVIALAASLHFLPQRVLAQTEPISTYERAQAALENRGQLPESLVGILGSSKLRHWSYVKTVAWSPDGSLLGSVGGDGCLRLWNPDTGEQIKRFKSEPAWAYGAPGLSSLAFEPTGKRVAAGLPTNALRIWNIETRVETQYLKDDSPVVDVAWHPTQPLLATGGELVAKLWDISRGKVVRALDSQDKSFKRQFVTDAVRVTFSPDGKSVVVGHPDGSVRFWDVASGEVTRTIKAHEGAVQVIAIDARRDWLATAGSEGKVWTWRLSTGEPLREIQAHKDDIQGLAFHPREAAIYSGGLDGAIRKWNLETGEMLLEWAASRQIGPSSLAIHPSRDLIASAGFAIRLWNSATGKPLVETAGHLGGIQALKFTPDGSRLVTAGNDVTLRVWDAKTQQPLAVYDSDRSPVGGMDLTPNGKLLVTFNAYSGQIDVRYLANGVLLKSFKADGRNEAVAVSHDGRWLAATSSRGGQGVLAVWDLSQDALHGRVQAPGGGRAYFNRDGTQLLVVGSEFLPGKGAKSRLSVWDVESLKNMRALEDVQGLGRISASAISGDGATLALAGTSFDQNEKSHNQLVFWDWTKNDTRLVVDSGEHRPDNMAMAANGETFLTTSALQGEACVWDPRDGTLRETIKLCEGGHWAIGPSAFTADNKHVAIGMGNGTIYMLRTQDAPRNVAVKTAVPVGAEEPPADPWKALIGQPAPELKAEGWLFGEPTTLEALRGKWVALYFWSGAQSDQDMPGWMDMQQRLGDQAPTVVIVYPAFGGTVEDMRKHFDHYSSESWEGRSLPFRVLVDKAKPNVIPGTQIETGGATFASYRVMNARRGYRLPSLALLIGPDGTVKRQITSGPFYAPTRELENVMGVQAGVPECEKELLEQYKLPDGVNLRRFPPPYSQAREDYRFFLHGRFECTMIFEQNNIVHRVMTSSQVPLEFVLNSVVGLQNYEFIDPDNVLERMVAGDWCSRPGTPRAELLLALEKIARDEIGWKLHFERATVKQPVIVASGKWQLDSLPGYKIEQGIFLTVDDLPDPLNGGGGSGSLDEMFSWLGDRVRLRVVNEATDAPKHDLKWQDRLVSHMLDIRKQTPEGKEKLTRLLKNFSRQTGLEMKVEDRDVTAWRILAERLNSDAAAE